MGGDGGGGAGWGWGGRAQGGDGGEGRRVGLGVGGAGWELGVGAQGGIGVGGTGWGWGVHKAGLEWTRACVARTFQPEDLADTKAPTPGIPPTGQNLKGVKGTLPERRVRVRRREV